VECVAREGRDAAPFPSFAGGSGYRDQAGKRRQNITDSIDLALGVRWTPNAFVRS